MNNGQMASQSKTTRGLFYITILRMREWYRMKRLCKLILILIMVTIFHKCYYYKCHFNVVKFQNKSYDGLIKTRQRLARRKLRLQETCARLNTSTRAEYSSIYQRRAQDNEATGLFFRLGGR